MEFLEFLYVFIQKLIYMNNIFIYYFNQSSRLLLQNVRSSTKTSEDNEANEAKEANDFEENQFEEEQFEDI